MFLKEKPKAGEVWNTVDGVRVSIVRFVSNDSRTKSLLECSDSLIRTEDGVVWSPPQKNSDKDLVSRIKDYPKASAVLSKIPYFGLLMACMLTFAILFTLNALSIKIF